MVRRTYPAVGGTILEVALDDSTEHDWVGCMLVTVAKKLLSKVDVELKPMGLDARTFGTLDTIGRHSGITQHELSRLRLTDAAIVVSLVDGLEKAGWVRRTPDPKDRRRNMLSLTTAGIRSWKKAIVVVRRAEQEVLGSAGPELAQTLACILDAEPT